MIINNVIVILLLGLLSVRNTYLKILIILLILFYLLKKKMVRVSFNKLINDLMYVICVVVINRLLNMNLDVLNFSYFVILNCSLLVMKKEIKIENYMSIYLLLLVVFGGIKLCLSL